MSLGEIIQRKRSERGLSQEKLAELVGVSRQAVSKWELGDAVPDTDKLVPLCRALGITVDELLGNAPKPEPVPERHIPQPSTPEKKPGWFATHWYWLGLIPVVWGVLRLLQLAVVLVGVISFTVHTDTYSGAFPQVSGSDISAFRFFEGADGNGTSVWMDAEEIIGW